MAEAIRRGFIAHATAERYASQIESAKAFDLVLDPGKRLFYSDNICLCCSWLVDKSNLQPKKLSSADKKRARKLQVDLVQLLAIRLDRSLDDAAIDAIVDDDALREENALAAYGRDLLERVEGRSEGPATLALWRRFAWTRHGSPKKAFVLDADAILGAERALVARIAG